MSNEAKDLQLGSHIPAAGLMLQKCRDCGTLQYPRREICRQCLGDCLDWEQVSSAGELLSWTVLHASHDEFFRNHLPLRVGLVKLGCGPVVYAHLALDAPAFGTEVEVRACPDVRGREVFAAVAPGAGDDAFGRLRGLIQMPEERSHD